ncbi:porin [Rhodobacterales bacterium]|nr:porin [Rhodobacterales bacterium]
MSRNAVLGALAGLAGLAATPAFSADLPVAPESVDYVRICDAYGAQFYYIPGTETCLRVGGRLRTEFRVTNFGEAENNWGNRDSDGYQWRSRGYLYLDARTATEFGTLRAYAEMYQTVTNNELSPTLEKAYVQWGGLLAGKAQSNFDFWTGYAFGAQTATYSDVKTNQLAYTLAFGNGLSATIAAEDRSSREEPLALNGVNQSYGGTRVPDFVAALAISQGWGSAQIMGAMHQIYPNSIINGTRTGGDEDDFGWAVGAGVQVNFSGIAHGGSVALQTVYTDGASAYGSDWNDRITDAVYTDTGFDTTRTFNIYGGVNLGLTNTLAANVEGGYHRVEGGTSAYDFTQWDATANVVWTPVSGLEIGPEIQYRDIDYSNSSGLSDTYELYGTFRMQRTF